MRPLRLVEAGETIDVLLLGAHADDIEIGVGATILTWIATGVRVRATWCVASAAGERETEARISAAAFLDGAARGAVITGPFQDSLFPSQEADIKAWLIAIRDRTQADLVFTHRSDDVHQDHSTLAALTRNVFRDHLTLEYEIPKWDGDLGRCNLYVGVPEERLDRKISLLHAAFASQRSKDWFDRDTFRGLARLRGLECRAASRFAEAFDLKKAVMG